MEHKLHYIELSALRLKDELANDRIDALKMQISDLERRNKDRLDLISRQDAEIAGLKKQLDTKEEIISAKSKACTKYSNTAFLCILWILICLSLHGVFSASAYSMYFVMACVPVLFGLLVNFVNLRSE